MLNTTISVIVPVYHGKKYIKKLINQIEQCKKKAGNEVTVELVLSNDAPDDKLDNYISDLISICVLNTNENRGMQGARIKGIQKCKGEYVLMLDQDDLISEDYFKSQLKTIFEKDGDVCVCRAKSENKLAYNVQRPFEIINDLDYALKAGVCILSPGQVLMKKSVISKVWMTHLLEKRGADDWLLWICMLAEGVKFVLNDDVLYEHVDNGANTSLNTVRMMQSDYEMVKILKDTHTLCDEQIRIFENTIKRFEIERIQLLDKFKKMFFVYDEWMKLNRCGKTIPDYLRKIGKTNVCIYGIGYIGKALVEELMACNINVLCAFDRNADYIDDIGIEIRKDIEVIAGVELVIVTLVENMEELCASMYNKMSVPIVTIGKLLEDMQSGIGCNT